MKENKIQKKISKLEEVIKELEDKKTTIRKNAEYNARQEKEHIKTGDYKKYEKVFTRENFYRKQMVELDNEINDHIKQKTELQKQLEDMEYSEKLKEFDLLMVEHLTDLVKNLDNILEGKAFDPIIADRVYSIYVKESKDRGINKPDLLVYETYSMGTIKTRFAYILEWIATIARKDKRIQPALKTDKVDKFAGLMRTLALSCLSEIEGRNSKTLKEKLKEAFKHE